MLSLNPKKDIEVDFATLLKRGINLSFLIFVLSAVFLVAWIVGNDKEYLLVSNSSIFSRIFFFLNPKIFTQIFLKGNVVSYAKGAVNEISLVFLIAYLTASISYISIVFLCIWLFVISFNTSIRIFHYIACLGLFPIVGVLLISWFIFKIVVFKVEVKRRKISRFNNIFEPEIFEDSQVLSLEDYSNREVTSSFTYKEYEKFFSSKKPSYLHKLRDWLHFRIS